MDKHKEQLLSDLKTHIDFVVLKIQEKLKEVKVLTSRGLNELRKIPKEDQAVYLQLQSHAKSREVELSHLQNSPYFMKCEVSDSSGSEKTYFFAKHEFSEESIYSWVSPVAAIRFDDIGETSYKLPDGTIKKVVIKKKEQYMIVDGKVLFFAMESENKPRELIYQEHFTKQKSEFALPEIVAQMEKAQDQVIRASYKGPLVVSGPAGSGKTTLALHRVAYLTQAPDTAHFYPTKSIIVFVQDNGTRDYFSKLLPGLGINDVLITTFSEWAFNVLNMSGYSYIERSGKDEEEKDLLEYKKLSLLRNTKEKYSLPKNQKTVDRFDLTMLLRDYLAKNKKFEIRREYQTYVKDKLVNKTKIIPVEYSLIIVDEFQNYLPEQLQIFNQCLNANTQSVIYVGDLAQQVKLGTVKTLKDVGLDVLPDRNVRLQKVYRNTKNILLFIQSLGYEIGIPEGLKEGPSVTEKTINSSAEEIQHIKNYLSKYEKGSIGIIAKDESYLKDFKKEFCDNKNVYVMTMLESQGVEFDLVCIVGINEKTFEITHHKDVLPEHLLERGKMQRDLLYVALTRAISELHVLGSVGLGGVLK